MQEASPCSSNRALSSKLVMLIPLFLCTLAIGCGNGSSAVVPGALGNSASTGASTSQSALPAPSINSVTLSWEAPVTNADGTALTNLAGYYIHYGTELTAMNQVVSVPTPGLTNYVIDNLPAGTYYFSITSYTAVGAESSASAVISATLG